MTVDFGNKEALKSAIDKMKKKKHLCAVGNRVLVENVETIPEKENVNIAQPIHSIISPK